MHIVNTGKMLAAAAAVGLMAGNASAIPLSGLVYQLDASKGITLSGGNVSAWADQSGNGNNFTQGSSTKQPLFIASSANFNGKAAIRFDGDNTGSGGNPLINPNTDELNLGSSVNVQTVFIVNRTTRDNGVDGIWGINNADKGIRRNPAGSWSHPGNPDDFSNTGSLTVNGNNTVAAALNTTHIVTASRSSALAMPTTSIGDYFQVNANPSRSWQGEISEIIAYDRALTARETHQVQGELGLKYGLSVRPGFVIAGPIGGDLTDPENDGDDTQPYNPGANQFAGFNAIFTSNTQPGFSGESAFNAFDNKSGPAGGSNKWCCNGPNTVAGGLKLDAQIIGAPNFLTSFTLTSSNDSPERDPLIFSILGSNDGVNFDTIFAYNNEFGNLFTARDQTLVFEAGVDFAAVTKAYSTFRYQVNGTGNNAVHAIAEIEYFGFSIPEPMTAALSMMMLGALGIRTGRRSRLA